MAMLGKFGSVNSTQGPPVVPPRITPSPVSCKFKMSLKNSVFKIIIIIYF